MTIDGGDDNDTIDNSGTDVLINGGKGNDSILNTTLDNYDGDANDGLDGSNVTHSTAAKASITSKTAARKCRSSEETEPIRLSTAARA